MYFDDGSHFSLSGEQSVTDRTLDTNNKPASPNIESKITFKKFMEAIKNGNFENSERILNAKIDGCLLLCNFDLMFSVFR